MSPSNPTEQLVKDVAAVYFGAIGAAIKRGAEIDDAGERGDAGEVLLKGRLGAALHRLNPELPHDSIEEVVRILSRPPHPTLIQNNRWFHAQLTDGVEIEYRDAPVGGGSGETRGGRARLVDFDNPAANDLLVVRQLTITRATFDGLKAGTPESGVVSSFERVVKPLLDVILASRCESAKLAEMCDYLLPKLLSGKERAREPAQPNAVVA